MPEEHPYKGGCLRHKTLAKAVNYSFDAVAGWKENTPDWVMENDNTICHLEKIKDNGETIVLIRVYPRKDEDKYDFNLKFNHIKQLTNARGEQKGIRAVIRVDEIPEAQS